MRRIDYIIIHHSGATKATFMSIKARHLEDFGWDEIGYHYLIFNGNSLPDGEIVKGRPIERGACQSRGVNSKAIGILFSGNFDIFFPSKLQWNAGVKLVKELMEKYSIPSDNILGHREVPFIFGREADKSCPGFKFDMDRFRKEVYEWGSEIFSDGMRRRNDLSISYDGVLVPDVEPQVAGSNVVIDVNDIAKIFNVNVEFHPRLRRVEINHRKSEGD